MVSELSTSIRRATAADIPSMVEFLRQMLSDMAAVGGYPVARETEHWKDVATEFQDHLKTPGCLHLLAETVSRPPTAVGWSFARSSKREPVFEPAQVLHISALYVSPPYRRQGIGRALLTKVLEWGRSVGCMEAELNVLANNPARALYRELGFADAEIEMTRTL
jgi:GNAT superfamily N-acetyltransferase